MWLLAPANDAGDAQKTCVPMNSAEQRSDFDGVKPADFRGVFVAHILRRHKRATPQPAR